MIGRDDNPDSSQPAGDSGDEPDPVAMPIDGTLDLHMFPPREVKSLVADYLDACLEAGILDLRIVHGKGIGNLRRIVHAVLARHPAVESFGHRSDAGSWGATVVRLREPADPLGHDRGDNQE